MKNTLFALFLILTLPLGSALFLPHAQADQWPYSQSGFNQTDEDDDYEDEDGIPPEGETMPGMDEGDEDEYNDSDEDIDDGFNGNNSSS